MKKTILLFICFVFSIATFAQNTATSSSGSFDIRKKIEPPLLEFLEAPTFVDFDGNKAINANEKCSIVFKLRNSGKGDALNLTTALKATGSINGVTFKNNQSLIKVGKLGETQTHELPITSDINTVDGTIEFTIEIEEPNGFGSEKVTMQVNTRKFLAPDVKVVDFVIFSGAAGSTNLELKKPFSIQLLVQNLGQGIANKVSAAIKVPDNVFITNGEAFVEFDNLAPGEKKSIEYEMILNSKYTASSLPIQLTLKESNNKFASNWDKSFSLNQALAQQKIVVQAGAEVKVDIVEASLRSDVDKDIPKGLPLNSKKYALIIGCEDYAKYQNGLDKEVNVDFAANDARVFSEYVKITLGYPQDQVYLLIDPTSSQIKQNIEKLQKAIEIEKGKAEVLFYYSGHGLPDENTKEPFLIPVDVNGNNPQEGISIVDLYSKLTKFRTLKATVVLDACFSGGARNKELVAMKGVKVKPRIDAVQGNLVVFTSSKGTESSAVYKEKQHGYFTYFFLKNIKEYAGARTLNELFIDVNYQVSKEVLKIGKTQTPDVLPGTEIGDKWKSLTW
ncbi:caspase family protein [Flavobacterium sp.]|jgi:hypothetical protein|uniref:caspase family protein n=1 Tax=Flavobacterium sp. TaxID=239 RepID=UPI0037BE3789